jgi:YihY family inner membrane protein
MGKGTDVNGSGTRSRKAEGDPRGRTSPERANAFKRAMRTVDRSQQGHKIPAFVFGVVKKYGDDNGGSLAALLTYYGFLSLFPLLLVLVTILAIVAGGDQGIAHRIVNSALSQFPVIGDKLGSNIKTIHRNSTVGLVIGVLALLWGSTGVCQSAQYAMAQVWNIPKMDRPGFLQRLGRSGLLFAVGGLFLVVSSGLAGLATVSGKQAFALRLGGGLLSALADVALFVIVFRILTPKTVPWGDMIPGAVLAGVVWAILQTLGVYLMDHELRNASQLYGFFAIVLGALWWIYLAAQVVVYCAEINVVRSRRLWPRSLVQPPLTPADRVALGSYALAEQRRREVKVSTSDVCPPAAGHQVPGDETVNDRVGRRIGDRTAADQAADQAAEGAAQIPADRNGR